MASGVDKFSRWGSPKVRVTWIGASLGELPVPKAIADLTAGNTDAAGAAKQAADESRTIKKSLE